MGLKRPATAVKSVESRWTFAKGVATPAKRSSASVVRTATNRIVECVAHGVYRGRPPVTVAKGVKR